VITVHGRPAVKLVAIHESDPLANLRTRGLIREPAVPRRSRRPLPVAANRPVSDLVDDQRQ
jgi:antitoxin (DNA-binding transcriptional repressor) of toxin-antitoxin stability system